MKDIIWAAWTALKNLFSCSIVKGFLSICGTVLLSAIGNHQTLIAIFILVVLDIITGSLKAAKLESFTSSQLKKLTSAKIVTYAVTILTAGLVANLVASPIHERLATWIKDAVLLWIGITEFTSITENISVISGIQIPSIKQLKELWDQFRDKSPSGVTVSTTSEETEDRVIRSTTITIDDEPSD